MTFLFALAVAALVVVSIAARALILRNRELDAINRIGRELASNLDLAGLLGVLASGMARVLHFDSLLIAMPDDGHVRLTVVSRDGGSISERTIPAGSGLTGRVLESGDAVHWRSSGSPGTPDTEAEADSRTRELLAVPMRFGNELLGALAVQSNRGVRYDAWAQRILESVAAQAAIALRNARLFESERLAREERDRFFAFVTHEIRTPLTSVTGYAQLAEGDLRYGNTDSAAASVELVRQEADRVLRIADDVLDTERFAGGKLTIRREPTNLTALIEAITSRHRRLSGRPIELVPDGAPVMVAGDPERLTQLFENLVTNALKYSSPGTSIAVTAGIAGDRARVSVRDSGPGIPADELPHVFERFFRGKNGAANARGSGLGLAVCREIARLHDGEVSVDSQTGVGSTFTVELPKL